jgi:hypothetical protein
VRPWHVTPASALVALAGAIALGRGPAAAVCGAAAAAAIAHAARMLGGDAPAHLAGAGVAASLAVVAIDGAAPSIALAAAAWTIAELARPATGRATPVMVTLAASVAAILAPACVALVTIAGTRILTRPPRWTIVPVIAGLLAALLAIAAGTAESGALASLGARWYGGTPDPIPLERSLALLGDALGPMLAVAALGGLIVAARVRVGRASLAVLACALGGLLVDLRSGAPGATTWGLAALCSGLAIGRLAAMIRIASGQAIVAATCGMLLLAPAAWIALAASR